MICHLCMAHITLSIPDETYEEMKKHPEIKWSEIARKSILEKTLLLKKRITSKELLNLLPIETQESIKKMSEKEGIDFYKEMERKGLKRKKYLTLV